MTALMVFVPVDGFAESAGDSIVMLGEIPSNDDGDEDNVVLQNDSADGRETTAKLSTSLYQSVEYSKRSDRNDVIEPVVDKDVLVPILAIRMFAIHRPHRNHVGSCGVVMKKEDPEIIREKGAH